MRFAIVLNFKVKHHHNKHKKLSKIKIQTQKKELKKEKKIL